MKKIKHFSIIFGLGSLLLTNTSHAGTVMGGTIAPGLSCNAFAEQLTGQLSMTNIIPVEPVQRSIVIQGWNQYVAVCGNMKITFTVAGQQGGSDRGFNFDGNIFNGGVHSWGPSGGGLGGITILQTTLSQLAQATNTTNSPYVVFGELVNNGGGTGVETTHKGGGYSAIWINNTNTLLAVAGGGCGWSFYSQNGIPTACGGGGGNNPGQSGPNPFYTPVGGSNGKGGYIGINNPCYSRGLYNASNDPLWASGKDWSVGGMGGNGCNGADAGGGGYGGGSSQAGGGGFCNTNVGQCSASDWTNGGGNRGNGWIKVEAIMP